MTDACKRVLDERASGLGRHRANRAVTGTEECVTDPLFATERNIAGNRSKQIFVIEQAISVDYSER